MAQKFTQNSSLNCNLSSCHLLSCDINYSQQTLSGLKMFFCNFVARSENLIENSLQLFLLSLLIKVKSICRLTLKLELSSAASHNFNNN